MAEYSYLWSDGSGDGGPYDRDEWDDMLALLVAGEEGVIAGYLNELEVTNPSGLDIEVDTGGAVVDGKLYRADAAVTGLSVTTPTVGTTGFRVVLRKSWSSQTVRAAVIMNTDGNSDPPALTQVDGTTWEISLATGTVTTGGVVTLADDRTIVALSGSPSPMKLVAIGEIISSTPLSLSNAAGIVSVSNPSTGVYQITFSQEVKHVFAITRVAAVAGRDFADLATDLPATTVEIRTFVQGSASNVAALHVVAYA